MLRRFRYRESSLVCHLLTPDHGRVAILAKGAYRPKSAYSGVLDLFDTLCLSWTAGTDLGNLHSGSISVRRRALSRDLDRYRAGLRILELARLGARAGHEERDLFAETEEALDALALGQQDAALVCTVFDLKFLRVQGLTPALTHCAACGSPANAERSGRQRALFSPALGGRLCTPCAEVLRASSDPDRFRGRRRRRPLLEEHALGSIKVAQSLLDTPWHDLPRIRLDPGRTEGLRVFVSRFLEYHLEARPRVAGPLPGRGARTRP